MAVIKSFCVVVLVSALCAGATAAIAFGVTMGFEAAFAAILALPVSAPAEPEPEEEGEPLFLGILERFPVATPPAEPSFFAPRFGTGSMYGDEGSRSAIEEPSRSSGDGGWANDVWRGRPYFGSGWGDAAPWSVPEP